MPWPDVYQQENCSHVVGMDKKLVQQHFYIKSPPMASGNCLCITGFQSIRIRNIFAVEQGFQFQLHQWKSLPHAAEVDAQSPAVESDRELGIDEGYHSFLRKLFEKFMKEADAVPRNATLNIAVKTMNDAAGPSVFSQCC